MPATSSTRQYDVVKKECYINLRDGVHLACHLWLPVLKDGGQTMVPSPAILEFLPYWASVWTAPRDTLRHPYIASYGYACVRVDMRGSGDSEGLYYDEYEKQEQVCSMAHAEQARSPDNELHLLHQCTYWEQDDALEVMEWIATQTWYDGGGVSMYGKSWGGFNGLQVGVTPVHATPF